MLVLRSLGVMGSSAFRTHALRKFGRVASNRLSNRRPSPERTANRDTHRYSFTASPSELGKSSLLRLVPAFGTLRGGVGDFGFFLTNY